MAFLGKEYKFESQENFEEFVNAIPIAEELKQNLLKSKPTLKLELNGDTYTLSTISEHFNRVQTFKSGVEFEDKLRDGLVAKSTITVDGNTVTQLTKSPLGELTQKREFNGDSLVQTITASTWDGVAKRYYSAA